MNLMQKLKRAGGKWLLSGDWSKLVELPLERRFSFRMRGREFLSLSVGEIKRLPADLRKRFRGFDKSSESIMGGLAAYSLQDELPWNQ